MTAPYAPQTWHDLPATDTPISAARLIVIENGVARYSSVQTAGSAVTVRPSLNFTGSGVSVSDNSGANRTDVTITAGSGSGIPTSLLTQAGDLAVGTTIAGVGQTQAAPFADGTVLTCVTARPTVMDWVQPNYSIVEDEGIARTTRSTLNFIGTGVSATDNTSALRTDVTIPGATTIYQTVTPTSGIFQISAAGAYSCLLTVNGSIIGIQDIALDTNDVIIIRVVQDSVGGHKWDVGPGTIVWEQGDGARFGQGYDNITAPYDTTPGYTTYLRIQWMGSIYGFYGEVIGAIPPLYYTPSTSLSWTIPTGSTSPIGAVLPKTSGSTTQPINSDITFMRYVSTARQTDIFNALLQLFSAATRLRILNGLAKIEMSNLYPEDGPLSNAYRGSFENSGAGYNVGIGGRLLVSVAGQDRTTAMGVMYHEGCHMLSYTYYSGYAAGAGLTINNPAPGAGVGNGSEPRTIESHSTLIALRNDCVTDQRSGHPPSGQSEWFAEMERGRRIGDNTSAGNVTGTMTAPAVNSSIEAQLGTGTTTGTVASRANRFVNYMVSLSLD